MEERSSSELIINHRRRLHDKDEDDVQFVSESPEKKPRNNSKNRKPKFRLKSTGEDASLSTSTTLRVPLMLTDIQHLLLHSLLGNLNLSQPPRWYVFDNCNKIAQTTCLIIEGVSIQHWELYKDKMPHLPKIFPNCVEVVTPSLYNETLVKELSLVPLSETQKESIIEKYGSMNLALEVRKDLMVMMKAVFPINDECIMPIGSRVDETFPRTQLILSAWQLIEGNFPLPLKGKLESIYSDYVLSKDRYIPVTSKSPMFGLDCEMCMTNAGSELTRISMVNEKHVTVYESFVKPYNHITDYLTRFSGITESLLDNVTKRLEDVQTDLKNILPPDAILVGHSLNIDLHALKMMHPYVIDTSSIYNITGERHRKPKLKTLAREFLNQDIQSNKNGHCSVEDALTTLKLVQLKLSQNIEFGDAVHTNRQKYKENLIKKSNAPQYALSIFNHIVEKKKTSLVVGCDDITGDYHTYLTNAKESLSTHLKKGKTKKVKLSTVENPEQVITTTVDAVKEYNLVMAHLKHKWQEEDVLTQIQNINRWVATVWDNLQESSLFVLVLGGTNEDNGVAMMTTKHCVR